MKRSKELFAQAGLLYSAAIWGSTFFLVKDALNSISPFPLLAARFLLAAALMLIVLKLMKKPPFSDLGKGLVIGVILFVVYLPQTIGLKFTTASNSGFITGLFIIFVPLMGWVLFRRVPERNKVLSVVLALAGLWVLTGGPGKINLGDMLTLITAFAYSLHILYAGRYMAEGADPYVITFQQFLIVGILSLTGSLMEGNGGELISGKVSGIIVFLAIFPTLLAFLVQMISQKFTSPLKVAIIFSLEPVFAALFAWNMGGEKFSAHRGLGGMIIVAAIMVSEIPSIKGHIRNSR